MILLDNNSKKTKVAVSYVNCNLGESENIKLIWIVLSLMWLIRILPSSTQQILNRILMLGRLLEYANTFYLSENTWKSREIYENYSALHSLYFVFVFFFPFFFLLFHLFFLQVLECEGSSSFHTQERRYSSKVLVNQAWRNYFSI